MSSLLRRTCFAFALASVGVVACGTEGGDGSAVGQLDVDDCWSGPFDLAPDFFGASPYRETLQIKLQRGSDFATYSDNLDILVTDINAIRPSATSAGKYNKELEVDLPPEVTPPGIPITPRTTPLLVNATLGLQRTCRTRNIPLHAVREVELQADGTCAAKVKTCDGTTTSSTTPPVLGKSKMIFAHLPNGKLDEPDAEERLVDGSFDLYFADPREACYPSPPPCRGHLSGRFTFYFSRGRPQQAFP